MRPSVKAQASGAQAASSVEKPLFFDGLNDADCRRSSLFDNPHASGTPYIRSRCQSVYDTALRLSLHDELTVSYINAAMVDIHVLFPVFMNTRRPPAARQAVDPDAAS
jgi:hypothetical protein